MANPIPIGNDYEFPMQQAMQCIPDYYGDPEMLDAFLFQIKFFAEKIPQDYTHMPLINVVTLKLKGAARTHVKYLRAETWQELKESLTKSFHSKICLEEIMQKIETLAQTSDETYEEYARRARELNEFINTYAHNKG